MRTLLVATLLALAGCQPAEPTLGGTVVTVSEADLGREPTSKQYEDPLVPEVAWKVDVRLDSGDEVTFIHSGERRYAPGERVYVLKGHEGALLL